MGNDGISTQTPGFSNGSRDGGPFGKIRSTLHNVAAKPVTLRRRAELNESAKQGKLSPIDTPERGGYTGQ